MEEKVRLLEQLGYSPAFIQALLAHDTPPAAHGPRDNKDAFEAIDIFPVDIKEIVIDKTDAPPSFIINSH